jgi:hypothetical protein
MTPEQYQELFQKHNVVPIQGLYLWKDKDNCKACACAVGIRLIDALGSVDAAIDTSESLLAIVRLEKTAIGLSKQFIKGLCDGWENERDRRCGDNYNEGYMEGAAARKFCLPNTAKGLTE